jgi:hypothetical protein
MEIVEVACVGRYVLCRKGEARRADHVALTDISVAQRMEVQKHSVKWGAIPPWRKTGHVHEERHIREMGGKVI